LRRFRFWKWEVLLRFPLETVVISGCCCGTIIVLGEYVVQVVNLDLPDNDRLHPIVLDPNSGILLLPRSSERQEEKITAHQFLRIFSTS